MVLSMIYLLCITVIALVSIIPFLLKKRWGKGIIATYISSLLLDQSFTLLPFGFKTYPVIMYVYIVLALVLEIKYQKVLLKELELNVWKDFKTYIAIGVSIVLCVIAILNNNYDSVEIIHAMMIVIAAPILEEITCSYAITYLIKKKYGIKKGIPFLILYVIVIVFMGHSAYLMYFSIKALLPMFYMLLYFAVYSSIHYFTKKQHIWICMLLHCLHNGLGLIFNTF